MTCPLRSIESDIEQERAAQDLGVFIARAAEINRRSWAAKRKRDGEFAALLIVAAGIVISGLLTLENQFARHGRINQETAYYE